MLKVIRFSLRYTLKIEELDANIGHYHKLIDGKIKEFSIYDDSQKIAHVMKAV